MERNMSFKTAFKTSILIPAYTAQNQALLITLSLTVTPQKQYRIFTNGNVAEALKPALTRAIEIMSTIQPNWMSLLGFQYHLADLKNSNSPYLVKDTRSAGLALAIGLMNIYRQHRGHAPVEGLIGTGILRIDGSFESSHKEEIKQKTSNYQFFITSNRCAHLFELNDFMEKINV